MSKQYEGGLVERTHARWLVLVLVAAAVLYLCNSRPDVVGTFHDDGVYVATAKALATGQSYKIISLPNPVDQTKYPIFYPYVLSLIWKMYPSFPKNVLLMKILSIVCGLSFLLVVYFYLVRFNYASPTLALTVVAITAFTPWVLYLSTMVLSEMPYALLSTLGLYFVELNERRARRPSLIILAALFAALAYLTRTVGSSLILSVLLFLLYRRKWTSAAFFFTATALMLAPWFVWTAMSSLNNDTQLYLYYVSYPRWAFQHVNGGFSAVLLNVWIKNLIYCATVIAGFVNPLLMYVPLPTEFEIRSGPASLLAMICLLFVVGVFVVLIRRLGYRPKALHVYLAMYLGVVLLWPWPPSRFLAPIVPFALLYSLLLIQSLTKFLSRRWLGHKEHLMRLVMTIIVATSLLLNWSIDVVSLRDTFTYDLTFPPAIPNPGIKWKINLEMFKWVRENIPANAIVAADYDPMIYLYTQRKAIRVFVPNPLESLYAPEHFRAHAIHPDAMVQILKDNQIDYLILTPMIEPFMSQLVPKIQDKYPGFFSMVFRSSDNMSFVFKINPVEPNATNYSAH